MNPHILFTVPPPGGHPARRHFQWRTLDISPFLRYTQAIMPRIEIAAEKLFHIGGFDITNTLITSWVVVALLVAAAVVVHKRLTIVPGGLQNVFEFFIEQLISLMQGVLASRATAEKYFPVVGTVFIFILTSNWLGIMPGIGSIGFFETIDTQERFIPLFRSAASDLNVTLALATVTVFIIHALAIGAIGFKAHISKFLSFRGPIEFFVGILELISECAKITSFSFRLFGNIFAGEVLLVVTGFLMPFGGPLPFLMLEIFVGFVQALVFAMLTTVFISIAVSTHDTAEEVARH